MDLDCNEDEEVKHQLLLLAMNGIKKTTKRRYVDVGLETQTRYSSVCKDSSLPLSITHSFIHLKKQLRFLTGVGSRLAGEETYVSERARDTARTPDTWST